MNLINITFSPTSSFFLSLTQAQIPPSAPYSNDLQLMFVPAAAKQDTKL